MVAFKSSFEFYVIRISTRADILNVGYAVSSSIHNKHLFRNNTLKLIYQFFLKGNGSSAEKNNL